MKKVQLILISFVILSLSNLAGQKIETFHSLKLGIDGINYSFEKALCNQFSLNFEAGGSFGFTSAKIVFAPAVQLEPRWYYNAARRANRGHLKNNSANFLCATTGVFLNPIFNKEMKVSAFVIPKFGFRRSLSEHFIFEAMLGAGLLFSDEGGSFMPGLNLRFGYLF